MHTPSYISPQDPTYRMIKGMVQMGMRADILGAVLEAFPSKPPIPVDVLRYTFGPLVVHVVNKGDEGLGWHTKDSIREWRPRVDVERLEILAGERVDLVSPTEIWLVVYNASMAAPLPPDLVEIYIWAAHRAYLAAGKTFPKDQWEQGGSNWPRHVATNDTVFDGHLSHTYRDVCREIRRKVILSARPGRLRRVTERS